MVTVINPGRLKMDINDTERKELSIIVIEDNPGDFVLVEDFLIEKFQRIRIRQFSDYTAVSNLLKREENTCDVILLDLHLPDRTGLELIENMLAISSKIPIIIFQITRLKRMTLKLFGVFYHFFIQN